MSNTLNHCPECGAPLSIEEQELQECWSCGWPEGDTPLAELPHRPSDFLPNRETDTAN